MKLNDATVNKFENPTRAADLMPDDINSQKVLQKRAEIFSKEKHQIKKSTNLANFICFRVGKNEFYGIPYPYTKEVIENFILTPLPWINDCISGVMNYRGALVSVLNLRKFFQQNDTASNSSEHNLLIIIEAKNIAIGILADYIVGSEFDQQDLTQPYDGMINDKYILGLYQGSTAILNMEAILHDLQQMLANK